MQLTVEAKVVIGRGNSKKEASEESAQQMWKLLEEENARPFKKFTYDYTTIQTEPFVMGLLPSDTRSPIDGLERVYPLGPPIDTTKQTSDNQTANTEAILTNYVGVLENLLIDLKSEMELYYVTVPTDAMTTDLIYLFINIGYKGEIPAFCGHGKGVTEVEAKNAAAFNLIDLLPDDFKKNIRNY